MEDFLTINSIIQLATLTGIIFAIYKSYKKPQNKIDNEIISIQKDIVSIDDKFKNINNRFLELEHNHIHTLKENMENNRKSINNLIVSVEKLSTIINERIPKNKGLN